MIMSKCTKKYAEQEINVFWHSAGCCLQPPSGCGPSSLGAISEEAESGKHTPRHYHLHPAPSPFCVGHPGS